MDSGSPVWAYGYEIYGLIVVTPRVRQLSMVDPFEWQYAGSIGMAELNTGELVNKFFTQVRFSHEFKTVGESAIYVTHAFWKLPTGVELSYVVYW